MVDRKFDKVPLTFSAISFHNLLLRFQPPYAAWEIPDASRPFRIINTIPVEELTSIEQYKCLTFGMVFLT